MATGFQSDAFQLTGFQIDAGAGTDALTALGLVTGAPTVGSPALGLQGEVKTGGGGRRSKSNRWVSGFVSVTYRLGEPDELVTDEPTVGAPSLNSIKTSDTLRAKGLATQAPTVGRASVPLRAAPVATAAPTLGNPRLVHDQTNSAKRMATILAYVRKVEQEDTWSPTSDVRWSGDVPEQLYVSKSGLKAWRKIRKAS